MGMFPCMYYAHLEHSLDYGCSQSHVYTRWSKDTAPPPPPPLMSQMRNRLPLPFDSFSRRNELKDMSTLFWCWKLSLLVLTTGKLLVGFPPLALHFPCSRFIYTVRVFKTWALDDHWWRVQLFGTLTCSWGGVEWRFAVCICCCVVSE